MNRDETSTSTSNHIVFIEVYKNEFLGYFVSFLEITIKL